MNILKNTEVEENGKVYKKSLALQRTAAIAVCTVIVAASAFCYIRYNKQVVEIFQNPEKIKAFLGRFKGFDKLVFVAIRALQTVVKIIPAEPLEIGSGILYGTFGGLLLCISGTLIGSLIIILLTRKFGRKMVNLFVPTEKIDSLAFLQDEKNVYLSLFIIYLIPGTPKDIITYVAGITKLDMKKFMLITTVARLPSIITSTWCGAEITSKNYNLAILICAVTLLLSLVLSIAYKKHMQKKEKYDSKEESGS